MKVYYLISKVKRYYRLLRHAYKIVTEKYPELSNVDQLQMAIKVINDIVGLNELILMLLIFEAYLKITELNPPNPIIK